MLRQRALRTRPRSFSIRAAGELRILDKAALGPRPTTQETPGALLLLVRCTILSNLPRPLKFARIGTSIQVIGLQFQAQAGPRGSTTFTLDGSSTTVGDPPAQNTNQDTTLFSKDNLSNGQHTLHITNNGVDLLIDFFKVGTAGTSSSGQQSQNPPAASSTTTAPATPTTTAANDPPPSTSQQQTQSTSSPQSGSSDPSNNSSGNASSCGSLMSPYVRFSH